ncbi:MAG: TolC family protein [Bacteroidetes bacterium]|nr:TolC family protein [Bacteroidota bacterium]
MFRLLILTLLLLPVALAAQESRKLTVEDAVRLGLENSKSLGIAEKKIDGASAKSGEAFAQRLPSLKLSAAYTRLSDVPAGKFTIPADAFGAGFPPAPVTSTISPAILNSYGLKATIQQPVFTGFRLENNQKMAQLSETAARLDFEGDKNDFVYEVRSAYWNLFRAIEVKKVVDENIDQVKAHLKDAQNLLAQGLITNNDVLKVQVQLSNVELLGIDARNAVQLARMYLNNLMGLPLDAPVEPVSLLTVPVENTDPVDVFTKKAMDQRPDLKALQARYEVAGTAVKLAKGSNYPQVMAMGNYYYNRPNQRFFPTKDAFKGTWDIGLQVSFDVWNWGQTKYQTHQATAQADQVKYAKGLLEDAIRLEINRDYLAEQQAREKIVVAKETIRQAEESYRITSEKFRRGVALTTDLLDAEVAVLQAKTNHTQALVDYVLAKARLQKAVGEQ